MMLLATTAAVTNLPAEFVPAVPTMTTSELRPGMRGHGLTVFRGTEPVRFDVTILGVLESRFADGEMILFEADSQPEVGDAHREFNGIGVIAGMSGSPVFIDDKLIGAVAYGWGFSIRPIGGITPIHDMLKVYELITTEAKLPPTEVAGLGIDWEDRSPANVERVMQQLQTLAPGRRALEFSAADLRQRGVAPPADAGSTISFRPLSMPLAVSSSSPSVHQWLARFFGGDTVLSPAAGSGPWGMVGTGVRQTGFLDAEGFESYQPVNGGAVAVVLANGDLQLAGTGTISYVEGDRLIAFGHPMFGLGSVDAPVWLAEIASVIPSVVRPFKIGNAVKEIGALREDRLAAIGATMSARSPMVPLHVRISAEETGVTRDFHFDLWNNRNFIPQLSMICFMEAMDKAARLDGPMVIDTRYAVRLADGRRLERRNYSSGQGGAFFDPMINLLMDVGMVLNNRWEPVQVAGIDVEATVTPRARTLQLVDRVDGPNELRRGETFRARLRLDRWREEPVFVPIEVQLPANLRPGQYEVVVANASARYMVEFSTNARRRRVESLNDMLRDMSPVFREDTLYVLLMDPTGQMVMDGQQLDSLPASVAGLTRQTIRRNSQPSSVPGRILSEQRIPMGAFISGATSFPITVRDENSRR
jgi:hypothetical protein